MEAIIIEMNKAFNEQLTIMFAVRRFDTSYLILHFFFLQTKQNIRKHKSLII